MYDNSTNDRGGYIEVYSCILNVKYNIIWRYSIIS